MAVMGERLPEAWMVEMHRNGRVEFPLRRRSMVLPPTLFVLPLALTSAHRIPEMLDGEWRFLAYLTIAAYGSLAAAGVWQLITQRPVVVVDRTGIHHGRRRFMAWSEIGWIGFVSGPKIARQFSVMPKDVWAKSLVLNRQHVNDLQTFRTWLEGLLDEYRQAAQDQSVGRADGEVS